MHYASEALMPAPSVSPAPPGGKPVPRWQVFLPAGFVLLALVALLLTPFWVQRQVRAARADIVEAADPARTLITRAQFLLARQISTLRGFFISGDETYLRQYNTLLAQEERVYVELGPLVSRLGPEVVTNFAALRVASARWHARLDEDEIRPRLVLPGAQAADSPFEQTLYLNALEAATRLDESVLNAGQARRVHIEAAERRGLGATVVLALLAVAAALVVALLGVRVQQLAHVAEMRRAEAEQALAAKAEAVEARARMLRGVTHDVQNPLGAADGYAELLELGLRGSLSDSQADYVAKIRRSIRTALHMIRDLLDLATAETGALHMEWVRVDLVGIVREAAEDHQSAARAAGHHLETHLPPDPLVLHTDPTRVRQILGNLLSNAIKYTPAPGRVEITVARERDGNPGAERTLCVARVCDSGPGIPPDQREQVFQEFARLHSGAVQGHGLGLAISRRIARLLGGDLTVEEGPHCGAQFVLRLPDGAPPAETA